MSKRTKTIIQLTGFLLGLAMLGWALRMAFSPANRAQLDKLTEAPPQTVFALIALSLVPILVNGLVFRLTLSPVQKLRWTDLAAVNAVCTFLSYLPFKIGALTRVAIHRKRDNVPIPRIGAWFGALLVVIVPPLTAASLATWWRSDADPLWWTATILGTIALALALAKLTAVFEGDTGLARIRALAEKLKLPAREKVLHAPAFEHLHDGFAMTAHTGVAVSSGLLRIADIVAQSWRFVLAAGIIGVEANFSDGVILTIAYFLIGLLSPFGLVGTREAGVVVIASALGLAGGAAMSSDDAETFALMVLIVSAADLIAVAGSAAVGLAWLRPDRLFRGVVSDDTQPGEPTIDDANRPPRDQPDDR